MADHARISPSKLPYLKLCPGRLQAEDEVLSTAEQEPSGPAAIEGTKRHALLEWRQGNLDKPWPLTVVAKIDGEEKELPVTSDDVEAVGILMPYISEHPSLTKPSARKWIEKEVEIGKWCGLEEGQCWGTADIIFADRDQLEIVDAKFGRRLIDPDSDQLKAYAIGAGNLLEWQGAHAQIRTLKLTIAQPTAEIPIRSAVFPVQTLGVWMDEYKKLFEQILAPNPPRIPGETQCRYCLARGTCRARLETIAGAMQGEDTIRLSEPFSVVGEVEKLAEEQLTKDPAKLDNEEIGRILDISLLAEGFFKDVRQEAHRRVSNGKRIPGWKLVEGRKSREYTVGEEDADKVLRSCGLKVSEIYEKKLISVPQADAKVKIKGAKAIAKFAEIWRTKPGKPVLVPEAAPGKPIRGETMFEPQDQPQDESEIPDFLQ